MSILFIEPFYTGSHKAWLDSLVTHSEHEFLLYTLPGRHWKWRMEASAIFFAEKYVVDKPDVDLIICSDFMNLALFLSLAQINRDMPIAIYFHENQLTYPWSKADIDVETKRDRHYAFINYTSALVADVVLFNSSYHLNSFTNTLPSFLSVFPDKQGLKNVDKIRRKSQVLALGFNFEQAPETFINIKGEKPVVLWNHRWEYDKNPAQFFQCLSRLKSQGIPFELIVCGEKKKKYPSIFDQAQLEFSNEIIHFGFASSKNEYLTLLDKSDIILITSNQDFFGISMVEAMMHGVYPIAPNRLAYPEHFDEKCRTQYLYNSEEEMLEKLVWACKNIQEIRADRKYMQKLDSYKWSNIIDKYDALFEKMVHQKKLKLEQDSIDR